MRGLVGPVLVAFIALLAGAARAENYPSRLIRAMIPYGAGSAADVVPRLVFDRLSAELGQGIVVENRPGAGGTLGTALVAKAEADGYSILAQSSALAILCPQNLPECANGRFSTTARRWI
jgi:tripartite-type tricarboxylate transporter receptor subunit TctC